MLVVTLAGSPSLQSRSGILLEHSRQWLERHGVEVRSYGIRDFDAEDLLHARFDSPQLKRLNADIAAADGVLIATPVYKASMSGALKTVLDLLPERALEGKVALPLASGGSIAHMLAVDYALKPVLSVLKAEEIVHGVFAEDRQIEYGAPPYRLAEALQQRLEESLAKFQRRVSALSLAVAPLA